MKKLALTASLILRRICVGGFLMLWAAGFFSVGVKETPDVMPSDRGIVVPAPVMIVPGR